MNLKIMDKKEILTQFKKWDTKTIEEMEILSKDIHLIKVTPETNFSEYEIYFNNNQDAIVNKIRENLNIEKRLGKFNRKEMVEDKFLLKMGQHNGDLYKYTFKTWFATKLLIEECYKAFKESQEFETMHLINNPTGYSLLFNKESTKNQLFYCYSKELTYLYEIYQNLEIDFEAKRINDKMTFIVEKHDFKDYISPLLKKIKTHE